MIRRAVAIAAMVVTASCDGGLRSFGGEGKPIDAQVVHPNATVFQILSLDRSGDRVAVSIRILNGRDRDITLTSGNEDSYIVADGGEKLLLVPSATNAKLSVPPGKAMDGTLVFTGKLPSSGTATLILNGNSSRDSQYTSSPRFDVSLPLDSAGGGDVAEQSALSNMRALPVSRLGLAAAAGSQFGAASTATSSLSAVDKLKSELGAVESDRGTIVSLPGDVTFDFNKATIRQDAEPTLGRLAQLITAGAAGDIIIEGHTDAKGDDAYNKRLSEQRAEAVKAHLVTKGVDATRLRTIGLGELRPIAPNANADASDDEAGRQRNRRVEVILPKGAGPTATPTSKPGAP
ncbi:OmpA family protein [uncultured Sphingomonas sp.]|uniref:OmpA family protein n=1 Tax=uncultured Sphingomonas sp. TaxID=158754 RepID=UPI0035CB9A89